MFIVIEGGDAVGKNTLVQTLKRVVHEGSKSFPKGARLFSFPQYATDLGRVLKQWLETGEAQEQPLAFQAMMTVDRYTVAEEIRAFAKDPEVLCIADRWWQSGFVYGSVFGLDETFLEEIHKALPQAELNFLLDAPSITASARRPEKRDSYERNANLMSEARANYCAMWASRNPRHWKVIDATQDPLTVFKDVYSATLQRADELASQQRHDTPPWRRNQHVVE